MRPTWGPPRSCRPQMGPMLAAWTLLLGDWYIFREMGSLFHGVVMPDSTQCARKAFNRCWSVVHCKKGTLLSCLLWVTYRLACYLTPGANLTFHRIFFTCIRVYLRLDYMQRKVMKLFRQSTCPCYWTDFMWFTFYHKTIWGNTKEC